MLDTNLTDQLAQLDVDQLKEVIDTAEQRIDQTTFAAHAKAVAPLVQACRDAYLAHPDQTFSEDEAMAWISQQLAAHQQQRQPINA
jgi:fructose-specific phosphotransferase system component IIB